MKLRFDPDQPHQRAAIQAVLEVVAGQPHVSVAEGMVAGREHGVVANRVTVKAERMLEALHGVQDAAGLPRTELDPRGEGIGPQLAVEMETGTGKTYAYLRTVLELARRHGLRKIVVVVPSVAIREGVLKTLRITAEHFAAILPGTRHRFFAYDGSRLGRLRAFTRSSQIEIMVVTLDAFNKASNLMRRPSDAFAGQSPIASLQAVRPVVVLDEPQRMESPRSRAALVDLAPALVLRYSATHRHRHALVHRLTPRQAHVQGLVKRIEVAAPATGIEDRHARIAAQIEATVRRHVKRQAELAPRGIKVLSLLFVEHVADWVEPEGLVRRELQRCWESLAAEASPHSFSQVCAAYFAERRKAGRSVAVDSRTGQSAADEHAYALIMRDKERLLSFEEPVCFVVSHSALREGWDNPNVFVLCTLARSRSEIRKRQEIGRGVRLAVGQSGERVLDPEVNVLTVVANDSYEDYVAGLQDEDGQTWGADERAPAPERIGQGSVSQAVARTEGAPPWRPIDGERLRTDACAHAQRAAAEVDDPSASPTSPVDALTELLLRRRPPCLVSRATMQAVLEVCASGSSTSWRAVERAAAAIVHALEQQEDPS